MKTLRNLYRLTNWPMRAWLILALLWMGWSLVAGILRVT